MRYPKTLRQGNYGIVTDQHRYPATVRGVPIPEAENRLQQQQLGGGIPKPAKMLEAVDHVSKGDRKDRSNGMSPGRNVQGGGTVSDIILQQLLVGDRGDAQGPDIVPP